MVANCRVSWSHRMELRKWRFNSLRVASSAEPVDQCEEVEKHVVPKMGLTERALGTIKVYTGKWQSINLPWFAHSPQTLDF